MKHILSLLIFCLLTGMGSSRTLLVPEHYSRLQDAILHAKDGDTLSVRPATINDPRVYEPIDFRGKSLVLLYRDLCTQAGRIDGRSPQNIKTISPILEDVEFVRGDVNMDYDVTISDGLFVLRYLFIPGSPSPSCMDAADANDNGLIQLSDGLYILRHLFVPGSPSPPLPYPQCGLDPTPDTLTCLWFPPCYWVGQRQVNEPDTIFDTNPDVDMDPNGYPWVVWFGKEQAGDQDEEIFYTKWNGSSWEPEGQVNVSDTLGDYRPTIAIDDEGIAFVSWHHRYITDQYEQRDIWYSRRNGPSWDPPLPIYISHDRDDYAPVVSAGGSEVWVVWYEGAAVGTRYYSVFASKWNGSSWDPPMQVSPPDSNFNWWAYVDVDSTGRPHVVYCAYFTGGIYYTTCIDSSWTTPILISDTALMEGYNPAIEIDENGSLHVLWVGLWLDPVVDYDIYYSFSSDGVHWSEAVMINDNDNDNDGWGRIAVNSLSDIWSVWHKEYSLWDTHVFVSHFDGGSWSSEFRLNDDSTITHLGPVVKTDNLGRPWVAWCGNHPQPEIYYNRWVGGLEKSAKHYFIPKAGNAMDTSCRNSFRKSILFWLK